MNEKNNIKEKASRIITRRIVNCLKKFNISQADVSRCTNKDHGNISKIFNDKRDFSLDDIKALEIKTKIPLSIIVIDVIYGQNEANDVLDKLKAMKKQIQEHPELAS